jgi:membrane-bound lytic murein transglycosylase MltF
MINATLKSMGVKDPYDINQNVEGTSRYFKGLLDAWMDYKRSASLALASYKCGYYNVKKNQGKLSSETLSYISDILSHYKRMLNQAQNNIYKY